MLRAFADEAQQAAFPSLVSVSTLWDIKAFYDSLDLELVARAALKLDYPPQVLGLELVVHMAPRILREGPDFSEAIQPGLSVLAGTRGANDLARCVLFTVLQETYDRTAPCSPSTHGSMMST